MPNNVIIMKMGSDQIHTLYKYVHYMVLTFLTIKHICLFTKNWNLFNTSTSKEKLYQELGLTAGTMNDGNDNIKHNVLKYCFFPSTKINRSIVDPKFIRSKQSNCF